MMPKYKASAACFLRPDGGGTRRVEPGEVLDYSGVPSIAMIPMDAAARAAKRRLLPDVWSMKAQPSATVAVALGLGARANASLSECRQLINDYIKTNPITKETAA